VAGAFLPPSRGRPLQQRGDERLCGRRLRPVETDGDAWPPGGQQRCFWPLGGPVGRFANQGACGGPAMDFRILGPLEVARDGEPLALGAVQQRAVLAVLVLHLGEVVSTDRLIDELWRARAPAAAAKTVQVYVSHL